MVVERKQRMENKKNKINYFMKANENDYTIIDCIKITKSQYKAIKEQAEKNLEKIKHGNPNEQSAKTNTQYASKNGYNRAYEYFHYKKMTIIIWKSQKEN